MPESINYYFVSNKNMNPPFMRILNGGFNFNISDVILSIKIFKE
jgi:hypothetical protein